MKINHSLLKGLLDYSIIMKIHTSLFDISLFFWDAIKGLNSVHKHLIH
jgi:hypothetical protein